MVFDAAAEGRVVCNKFKLPGLGLEEGAEALAARGCLVAFASREVCELEEGEGEEGGGGGGGIRVLVGAAGEVAVPKVSPGVCVVVKAGSSWAGRVVVVSVLGLPCWIGAVRDHHHHHLHAHTRLCR